MASKPSASYPSPLHDADARLLQHRSKDHTDSPSAYLKPTVKTSPAIGQKEWLLVGLVVLLAMMVRLWKIWEPNSVVFVLFFFLSRYLCKPQPDPS